MQKTVSLFFLVLFHLSAKAQDLFSSETVIKPKLFADMPAVLAMPAHELETVFSGRAGQQARIVAGNDFPFNGTIVSVTAKNENTLFSVIIKLADKEGSFLTISKMIREDNSVSYAGTVLSFKHDDCYVLQRSNGVYTFVKKRYKDLIND